MFLIAMNNVYVSEQNIDIFLRVEYIISFTLYILSLSPINRENPWRKASSNIINLKLFDRVIRV